MFDAVVKFGFQSAVKLVQLFVNLVLVARQNLSNFSKLLFGSQSHFGLLHADLVDNLATERLLLDAELKGLVYLKFYFVASDNLVDFFSLHFNSLLNFLEGCERMIFVVTKNGTVRTYKGFIFDANDFEGFIVDKADIIEAVEAFDMQI